MKLKYLRDFIAAANCSDMKKTAEELNISQSVLSKHIKAIEDEIDAPLFVSGKKNILTSYGKAFLPYAIEIVNLEDDYNSYKNIEVKNKQTITIAMSPIQTRELSGRIVENFIYSNPSFNVNVIEASNFELIDYVKKGKCDFAFYRTQSKFTRDKKIASIPVFTSHAVVYVSKNDPLASKTSISFKDLLDKTIYLRNENSMVNKVCEEQYKKIGNKPEILFASEHIVYENIKQNKGVTIYLSELNNTEFQQNISVIPIQPELSSYVDLIFKKEQINTAKATFLQYAFQSFIVNL